MQQLIAGFVLFTLSVFILVGLILFVRAKLVKARKVTIEINQDPARSMQVDPGQSLMDALASQGIALPTACGGIGMCALCRVRVLAGGGKIMRDEKNILSRRELAGGYRLACQMEVAQPLSLELPVAVSEVDKWECEVLSNRSVATFIKELVIRLPDGEHLDFEPGSYVQVEAPPHRLSYTDMDIDERFRPTWGRLGLWDLESVVDAPLLRAYSFANYPGEEGDLKLNVRITLPPPDSRNIPTGKVSSYLFSLKPGDRITITGPYGDFFPRQSGAEMIYIGGGSGMAPLRSHIFHLLKERGSQRKISYWYGARSLCEAFYQEEFEQLQAQHQNFSWHLALSEPQPEDHWLGDTGFIHQVMYDNYLKEHPAPAACEYYICGPPPMRQAILKLLGELGVDEGNILLDDFGQ